MNSGITAERVYNALKGRLLGGEFKPGERLDPALLSDSLSSSVTPVRDVLNILRGEGLVETRTGEGFFRPGITAPDLEDLYAWSGQVAALAVRQWHRTPLPIVPSQREKQIANRTADLLLAIAARSTNVEHKRAMLSLNDRLHPVRAVEGELLGDVTEELDAMAVALAADDARSLIKLALAYHRRRLRFVSEIVRAVYRT